MKRKTLVSLLLFSSLTLFGADADAECTDTGLLLLQRANNNPNATVKIIGQNLPIVFTTFAKSSSVETFKQYLDLKADLNARHPNGDSLIMFAAMYGHNKHLKELLDRGVNTEDQSLEYKMTPIMGAASHGNIDGVKLLVDFNANINAVSTDDTPVIGHAIVGKIEARKKGDDLGKYQQCLDYLMGRADFNPYIKIQGHYLPIWGLGQLPPDLSFTQSICLKYPFFLLQKTKEGKTILEILEAALRQKKINKTTYRSLEKKAKQIEAERTLAAAEAAQIPKPEISVDDLLAKFKLEDEGAPAPTKRKRKKKKSKVVADDALFGLQQTKTEARKWFSSQVQGLE